MHTRTAEVGERSNIPFGRLGGCGFVHVTEYEEAVLRILVFDGAVAVAVAAVAGAAAGAHIVLAAELFGPVDVPPGVLAHTPNSEAKCQRRDAVLLYRR